jgi:hypothetical protein
VNLLSGPQRRLRACTVIAIAIGLVEPRAIEESLADYQDRIICECRSWGFLSPHLLEYVTKKVRASDFESLARTFVSGKA